MYLLTYSCHVIHICNTTGQTQCAMILTCPWCWFPPAFPAAETWPEATDQYSNTASLSHRKQQQ